MATSWEDILNLELRWKGRWGFLCLPTSTVQMTSWQYHHFWLFLRGVTKMSQSAQIHLSHRKHPQHSILQLCIVDKLHKSHSSKDGSFEPAENWWKYFPMLPLSFMIRAEVLPSGCSIEVGICLHRRWHLRCRCRTRCQPLHFFKSCTVNYKRVMCGILHSFCHVAVKIAHLSTFVLLEF